MRDLSGQQRLIFLALLEQSQEQGLHVKQLLLAPALARYAPGSGRAVLAALHLGPQRSAVSRVDGGRLGLDLAGKRGAGVLDRQPSAHAVAACATSAASEKALSNSLQRH